jgi:hypothetical protein
MRSFERLHTCGFAEPAKTLRFSRARVLRDCLQFVVLLVCALGVTDVSADPLHIGTVVSDVPSLSLGNSNTTRAVAAAPDGTIYVAFLAQVGKELRVARSIDGGATFLPSALVDTLSNGVAFDSASLSVNSAGAVFIAYADTSSNVFLAHSSGGTGIFTIVPGLGATSNTNLGIHVQTQGNYVYVGYAIPGGMAVAASSDAGANFSLPPVQVPISGAANGLLVDPSNGNVVVAAENISLYFRVSHDHGATFDSQQNPSGSVYFSNWTISSDVSGSYLWVGGADIGGGDPVYQIDLSSAVSGSRSAFLSTPNSHSRSLYAAGCGDVVDSINGSWAAVHDFGTTIGTTYIINGSDQTTSINPQSGNVLIAYRSGSAIKLDVYQDELLGCGPHLSLTVGDGHEFARLGQTMNYLVTLSDSFTPAHDVAVTLSTPGSALDLANAQWQCIGNDNNGLCDSSSGTGASLGTVTVSPAGNMFWIVSVPVLTGTTDESIELDVNATGATTVSDVDALVIFRSGFDVDNPDGTQ